MAGPHRYAAFISYSSQDTGFARALHRALEAYRIPAALGSFDFTTAGRRNRLYPIFRDRDELPAGELGAALEAALAGSAALIVVCSPAAAASTWVSKEIVYFNGLDRPKKCFAIVAPTAPLSLDVHALMPAPLKASDPVAADARRTKDGPYRARMKIVAGMANLTLGQLVDRDRRRRREQIAAAALAAIGLLATAAVWNASVTMRRERTQFTARAQQLISAGAPLDAQAYAIAGVAPAGSALGAEDAAAAETLRRVGEIRDFGRSGILSTPDAGTFFVRERVDRNTSRGYVLRFGAQTSRTPLAGDFSRTLSIAMTHDGAALLASTHVADDDPNGDRLQRIDLRTGATADLGSYDAHRGFTFSRNGAAVAMTFVDGQSVHIDIAGGRRTALGGGHGENGAQFVMSDAGDVVATIASAGNARRATLTDFRRNRTTDLGPIAQYLPLQMSRDGNVLALRDVQNTVRVVNLDTGVERRFPPATEAALSPDGRTIILEGADRRSTEYDLETGESRVLGEAGRILFAGEARLAALYVEDGAQRGALRDLASGETIDLGVIIPARRSSMLTIAGNGAGVLAMTSPDPQGRDGPWRLVYHDFNSRSRVDLGEVGEGPFGPPIHTLAANGSALVIELEQNHVLFELAQGGRRTNLGDLFEYKLAADGNVLATWRTDGRGLVYDLARGRVIDLGDLGLRDDWSNGQLTSRGALAMAGGDAVIIAEDPRWSVVVLNLAHRIMPEDGDARSLARAFCAANADRLPPFSAEAREAERALRGRPWNPCDWRGLLAIVPPTGSNEGWFEGPKQAWRAFAVRWLQARDYRCAERMAAGSDDASRAEACARAEERQRRRQRAAQ